MQESRENIPPPFRLLLVGVEDGNLADLHARLQQLGETGLQVDCAPSCEKARARLSEAQYDLLLCGCRPQPEDSGDCLARIPGGVPVGFLREPGNESLEAALQGSACNSARQCSGKCLALFILSAIDRYRKDCQRQSSEEMLRKLRRTVEQSPDLVMITDCSGVLEYVNPAFESATGYSQSEVIGQTLGMLKSEQQTGELYEEMWDALLSGQTFRGVVMNRKKDGETFVLNKIITPLRNAAGEITHFISTGHDITDQRRLESQLQQAQKMDAIGRLAGGVAHDFNNLLMVISAYAELMMDSLLADSPLRHNVNEIITAARRAADLTRQLLAFGRKQMQSLQFLDLNAVIREISSMLPRLMGEDIQFVFVPGQDLAKVKADRVQIEQVVMNLAANARDAMPSGGKLTIEAANIHLDEAYVQRHAVVPAGDYVLLAVTDSGSGIAPEHLPHIFEPFYTTKEEGKGTGLGLATVYGIVKQNAGFIWVYSEAGLGTTFKIYLPQAQAAGEEASTTRAPQDSPRGWETLLVVEDEVAVRQSTREFLARNGYTVLEAASGEEALRVSRGYCGPIHLMVSDVVMPKMSGAKLAERLAAERPNMKSLFVSGYAETTVLQHGIIDVTARFLQKPYCLRDLARKVREILDSNYARAASAGS